MISDERLRHLSGPAYAASEPGQIAAELLIAREALQTIQRLRLDHYHTHHQYIEEMRRIASIALA